LPSVVSSLFSERRKEVIWMAKKRKKKVIKILNKSNGFVQDFRFASKARRHKEKNPSCLILKKIKAGR